MKAIKGYMRFLKRHRYLVLSFILVLLLGTFIFLGTQIFLFFNFMLGNDILVQLDSDKHFLDLKTGESGTIKVESTITTNPFCQSYCNYSLKDLSTEDVVDSNNVSMIPLSSFSKEYWFNVTWNGHGQRLYRFQIECASRKTFLCHTKKPAKRSIIFALNYSLDEKSLQDKRTSETIIRRIDETSEGLMDDIDYLFALKETLDDKVVFTQDYDAKIIDLADSFNNTIYELNHQQGFWTEERYPALIDKVRDIESSLSGIVKSKDSTEENLSDIKNRYNRLIDDILDITDRFFILQNNLFLIDEQDNLSIDTEEKNMSEMFLQLKGSLDETLSILKARNPLLKKDDVISELRNDFDNFEEEYMEIIILAKLDHLDKIMTSYRYLREFKDILDGEFNMENMTVNEDKIENVSETLSVIDRSLIQKNIFIDEKLNETYLQILDIEVCDEVEDIYRYSEELTDRLNSSDINLSEADLSDLNISNDDPGNESVEQDASVLINDLLVDKLPMRCDENNDLYVDKQTLRENITVAYINITPDKHLYSDNLNFIDLDFSLEDPEPECNIFGKDETCCKNFCKGEDYPVMLVHGHAFNQEISAAYSLQSFNNLQENLEKTHSYLDAGALSLYSDKAWPYGLWGYIRHPVSVKASYYYDVFQEPGRYVVVQTKSETLNTYSLRLKELIDTLKERTGKDKVKIIAHSMGGLITRRYLQIFGEEDVSEVLLIATPNHGISGNVANMCSFVGSKLECRDMSDGSLFLNKLSSGKEPDIPVHNIVGIGCRMDENTGDGIVKKESAELGYAKNYYINGSCRGIETFHTDILQIDKYPEIYEIIEKTILD